MANDYRIIKFTYSSATTSIEVKTSNETPSRQDLQVIQVALDGTQYRTITGQNEQRIYSFSKCTSDVFDFFNNAYIASRASITVAMDIENDDGTFTTHSSVIINKPIYQDDSVTTTSGQKVYNGLSVEVLL